jgi:TetR/AcrR family tetracycline transcriptional repressor
MDTQQAQDPDKRETPQPPWLQRPPRSRRTPLSREAIVEAALTVLDRDGLDGFSMRAVAQELGTGAASLYWHVRNRDELLNLVVDRVISEFEVPEPDPEHWQDQVKELAREMRRLMHQHRDIARITLGRIPVGPNTLEANERILALLRAAGVPDRTAARTVDLMSLYVGAYAFEESLGLASPTGEDLPPEQVIEMIRGYFASLPPERFPNTLRIVDQLFAGDLDERFEFGLDVLVKGLAAQRES